MKMCNFPGVSQDYGICDAFLRFQRWDGRQKVASHEGTAEVQSHTPSCSRPFGTYLPCGLFPSVKTPGYYQDVPPGQRNVADACSSEQATRCISDAFTGILRPRCLARKMCDTSVQGSGRILRAISACRGAAVSEALFEESENSAGCSLSLRERVRVRGNTRSHVNGLRATSNVAKTLCRVTTA